MQRQRRFFGIGLWLVLISFFIFTQAVIISLDHLHKFDLVFISRAVDSYAGMLWFLVGVLFWAAASWVFLRGWWQDRLVTSGPYRLCRHPMYAALIWFILPALGLISHSWLVMANVGLTYLAFKLLIGREDRYLETAFGAEYLAYRARTNELLPWPRPRPAE